MSMKRFAGFPIIVASLNVFRWSGMSMVRFAAISLVFWQILSVFSSRGMILIVSLECGRSWAAVLVPSRNLLAVFSCEAFLVSLDSHFAVVPLFFAERLFQLHVYTFRFYSIADTSISKTPSYVSRIAPSILKSLYP